jgi:hypothetical protein
MERFKRVFGIITAQIKTGLVIVRAQQPFIDKLNGEYTIVSTDLATDTNQELRNLRSAAVANNELKIVLLGTWGGFNKWGVLPKDIYGRECDVFITVTTETEGYRFEVDKFRGDPGWPSDTTIMVEDPDRVKL